ncbi:hypothetical protein BCR33DRAFT_854160 [Rhizoclosmatium globosum]|uniref:Transmembrane protein n=1 Tax=Rhizoclosmatium globosum TaxID=329046 RepID=A0A1Y2BTV6_9FUNG|nr:hypothetical protein BCR33DRAFT_854160 [Rhizoclosmatium globosum]|eukprot:ORY38179.1 hypothetical protein BCR33DRAFT_854160 [Rhizoclosmatium globosum]
MTTVASFVLRSLEYNITYPVAPSVFLVQLMRYKNATVDSIFPAKCSCSESTEKCSCTSLLAKRDAEAFDEAANVLLGLRAFFAVAVLASILYAAHNQTLSDPRSGLPSLMACPYSCTLLLEKTYLLTTGPIPFSSLDPSLLHIDYVLASTVSFYWFPPAVASEERGVISTIVCWGMVMEMLMSAWRVHGGLVGATIVWSLSIAAVVVAYKTHVPEAPQSVHAALESAMFGLELIAGSFTAVWIAGLARDFMFSPVCKVQECICKRGALLQEVEAPSQELDCDVKQMAEKISVIA